MKDAKGANVTWDDIIATNNDGPVPVVVMYHSPCMDGKLAASLLYRRNPKWSYIGHDPANPIDVNKLPYNLDGSTTLFLLDYIPTDEAWFTKALLRFGKIVGVDHHVSAVSFCQGLMGKKGFERIFITIDATNDVCATTLLTRLVPSLVDGLTERQQLIISMVDAVDRYTFEVPGYTERDLKAWCAEAKRIIVTCPLNRFLDLNPADVITSGLVSILADEDEVRGVMAAEDWGHDIVNTATTMEGSVKKTRAVPWEALFVPHSAGAVQLCTVHVNRFTAIPELGRQVANKTGRPVVVISLVPQLEADGTIGLPLYRCSVRHPEDPEYKGPTALAVAQLFEGGGGHVAAAGFSMRSDTFDKYFAKLRPVSF